MLSVLRASAHGADRQAGFTLIELLVAMVAGIVVLFALSAILIATLHQTQRTFTKVDATRQARTALAVIENELHSACVDGPLAPPVQTSSDDNNLSFLSFTGTTAAPTPVWHVLSFGSGQLKDASYAVTGSAPNWGRATSASTTVTLLGNVAQQPGIAIFRYFRYESYLGTDGNLYWTIPDGTNTQPVTGATLAPDPLSTPLSASNGDATVEIVISLLVGPTSQNLNNRNLPAASEPVQDAVSLRLTTPPNYSTQGSGSGDYSPCE
jgi:type II secretory pathway pseudopilin PulG